MIHCTIAIDGPAGAGKSSVAKKLATNLSYEYIDTGAMYRAYALKLLNLGLNPENEEQALSIINSTDIDFRNNSIYIDNKIVDNEIREDIVGKYASIVGTLKEIRQKMVELQRSIAKNKSVVMDGRDITTVVLPNANYKFYITATVEERGKRRYLELKKKGEDVDLVQVIEDIKKRDYTDMNREQSPLRIAEDAMIIDTSKMTIDEVVVKMINIIKGSGKDCCIK